MLLKIYSGQKNSHNRHNPLPPLKNLPPSSVVLFVYSPVITSTYAQKMLNFLYIETKILLHACCAPCSGTSSSACSRKGSSPSSSTATPTSSFCLCPRFCKTECMQSLVLCTGWRIAMHSWHRLAYVCMRTFILGPWNDGCHALRFAKSLLPYQSTKRRRWN